MMFFNHPAVRGHLLKHGWVYTLRDRRKREGLHVLAHGRRFEFERLGHGWVEAVKDLPRLDARRVRPYVRGSGFGRATEWFEAFEEMHGARRGPAFLYRVELLDRSP